MTRGFHFRLARVLRVRALEEEIARGDLLAAQNAASLAESRLESVRGDLARARDELAERQSPGRLETEALLAAESTLPALEGRVRLGREQFLDLRATADGEHKRWKGARRDLEGLQRLEGRARDGHRDELETRERRALDEVASQRAHRSGRTTRDRTPFPTDTDTPPDPS